MSGAVRAGSYQTSVPSSPREGPLLASEREALRELLFYYIYLFANLQNAKCCHLPWGK